MKKLIATLGLIFSSVSFATPAKHFIGILENQVVQDLDSQFSTKKMELISVRDTERRYRCPCWDYVLEYKNLESGEVQAVEIRVSDYDFDGVFDVKIAENRLN